MPPARECCRTHLRSVNDVKAPGARKAVEQGRLSSSKAAASLPQLCCELEYIVDQPGSAARLPPPGGFARRQFDWKPVVDRGAVGGMRTVPHALLERQAFAFAMPGVEDRLPIAASLESGTTGQESRPLFWIQSTAMCTTRRLVVRLCRDMPVCLCAPGSGAWL